uniref:Uncharacterized protein n=1 Tax=Cacopsylla melanoneura TaxID=428564 RepID=A0A8D8VZQ6_9HEMI
MYKQYSIFFKTYRKLNLREYIRWVFMWKSNLLKNNNLPRSLLSPPASSCTSTLYSASVFLSFCATSTSFSSFSSTLFCLLLLVPSPLLYPLLPSLSPLYFLLLHLLFLFFLPFIFPPI